MRGTHRLALAATQAVLDRLRDGADVALLHDDRLVPHQAKRRRVGITQVGSQPLRVVDVAQQLALVEATVRIDAALVGSEVGDLVVGQEFQLGDADAVLARDHAVERTRQRHDAGHRLMGVLQHVVVVRVDRQVGVHVAVAGVHVQRHENAAAQHLLVDRLRLVEDRLELAAVEDLAQLGANLRLPRHADRAVLQQVEQVGVRLVHQTIVDGLREVAQTQADQAGACRIHRRVEVVQQILPAGARAAHQLLRLLYAVFEQLGAGDLVGVVGAAQRQVVAREEVLQRVSQLELVLDRQLDVDALDAVGVLAHAVERDHHVFVDLEGVGVLGNRCRTRAIQPEFLARLGAHGHEAFTALAVGQADHFRGGARHGVIVIADDVTDQHHLRKRIALALGGVADRAQVALVQVLQASQDGTALLGLGVEVVLDLDDARHRVSRLAEELQAHSADRLGHAVQNPARAGDDAVAAFLLHTGQARQELVRHVLAQAFLAELAAFDGERFRAQQLAAHRRIAVEPLQFERGDRRIVDLAEVVIEARDFEPVAVRIDHAPPGEVVQRGAPQHGLLAARVHGDVAANARSVDRGRVHGEDETSLFRRFRNAARHHACARIDGRHGVVDARQVGLLDRIQTFQLFGIDDGRERRERHGAAGVAGAAPARDDGQTQLEAAFDDAGDFFLGIGREHHERIFDAPVGGVRHVRDARQAVELDVVLGQGPSGRGGAGHTPGQILPGTP